MTAPTQRPDPGTARRSPIARPAALAVSALIAFAVIAFALLRLLPAPRSHSDYLIVGTIATLAALVMVFAGVLLGRVRR